MIERRIIPRDELFPTQRYQRATDPRATCRRTIVLDGKRYRCGRETFGVGNDRDHSGIHDAFAQHGDGGSVRW